ncbi:(2Fe-2S)-binding protein [Anaerostipes hadrus]|jgi:bacterioferritin-associated ferredoxin|nr:(2Fe-2S)-binding protein [Anaerostipes hadrus]
MDREQIICPCLDITIGQIMDAYEQGAKSVDMIKEATGAGTVCGACLDEIEKLIQSL